MVDERTVLTADGVRLRVRVLGAGRDTVVVPLAAHLLEDLAPLARGRVVAFYDPRGRGASEAVRDTARLGLGRDVADLEAVRQALGAPRVALVGWSYFGAVAARYADRHPEHVTRLVQLAPIAPRLARYPVAPDAARPAPDTALARAVQAMRERGAARIDPQAYCRLAARLDASDAMADPAAWARRRSDPCRHPNEWPDSLPRVVLPILTGLGAYDWRDAIAARRAPTLVIQGTHDFVPPAAGDEWARAPGARLLRVRAGHHPHLEQPTQVLGAVADFLDGRWPIGAAAPPAR